MKKHLIIFFMLLASKGFPQDINMFFNDANDFFEMNVSNGKVAYDNIYKNQESLDAILKLVENISVDKDDAKVYQAFWINAYNLAVIKGIINNYPIKSPLDKPGFFDKITYKLAGKNITLNDIEHKLLRAQFKDPRFHFVLVCGAIGCPPLINEAYLPKNLEEHLQRQTKLALNGDYFIKVNTKKKRVEGSEILKWYREDFTMDGNSVIKYINSYRTEKIPENFKLSYFTYNWNLNTQ